MSIQTAQQRIMSRAVGEGTEKGAEVTVYYTDEAVKKIAHFFDFFA